MRKLLIIVSLVLICIFYSCNNKRVIEGIFYDVTRKKVFEFDKHNLQVYSLLDSTKEKYSIDILDQEINLKLKNDDETVIDFINQNGKLTLLDYNLYLSDNEQIELYKLNFSKSINKGELYNNYWNIINFDTDESLFVKIYDSIDVGDSYRNLNSKRSGNIFFDGSFYVNKYNYFNKFQIFRFQTSTFNDTHYLVERLVQDSLILFDLRTATRLKFVKYKSVNNDLIFGRWKWIDNNDKSLILPEKEGMLKIGDTIFLSKNFEFIINPDNHRIDKKYHFDIGMDSKYIFINELEYGDIKIVNISKDTLILENPYMKDESGKSLSMRYIKLNEDSN